MRIHNLWLHLLSSLSRLHWGQGTSAASAFCSLCSRKGIFLREDSLPVFVNLEGGALYFLLLIFQVVSRDDTAIKAFSPAEIKFEGRVEVSHFTLFLNQNYIAGRL